MDTYKEKYLTHSSKYIPYSIKKTVQPVKATKRSNEKVDSQKKRPHTLKQIPLKKKRRRHHRTVNKGGRGKQKGGTKNNKQQKQLYTIKIKKKDERSHQRLYQCIHWHPIDAEKNACARI